MTVRAVPIGVGVRYEGLSSDEKPSPVQINSTFREHDTGIEMITYDGENWVINSPVMTAGKEYAHLDDTDLVKDAPGILYKVVINKISSGNDTTVTLYDSPDDQGLDIIAVIDVSKDTTRVTLTYEIVMKNGLYAVFSDADGADITISYR
jgi:hypothetical protein